MHRLAQDITGIRTAVTMKRELESHRARERSVSILGNLEEDENAEEIMDSFQEHVGPSLSALAVRWLFCCLVAFVSGLTRHR